MFRELLEQRNQSLAHAQTKEATIWEMLQLRAEELPMRPGIILLRMDGKIVACAHYAPGITDMEDTCNIIASVQYGGEIDYNMDELLSLYEV